MSFVYIHNGKFRLRLFQNPSLHVLKGSVVWYLTEDKKIIIGVGIIYVDI